MAEGMCNNHGKIEAEWKEGEKNGRKYAFWGCPRREKDQFGNWVKCKVEMPNNSSGKFDQSIDKAAAQSDATKKDELITRTAIAKSLIEAGRKLDESTKVLTIKEANDWFSWIVGKSPMTITQRDMIQAVGEPKTEEIKLSDIPF